MTIYKDYASVYDASGQLTFSLRMIGYLERLLSTHVPPGNRMLDLACGTGTVALAMAKAGWQVWGIDGSPEMLAQARHKDDARAFHVVWDCQDMRQFRLPLRVHLVTCLYDSLNYMLTSDDLATVMRRVHEALEPNGLFLFDMNTAYALAAHWDDETYFADSDDLGVVFQSRYDSRMQRASVTVTCYERRDTLYRKIVETHVEQAYPMEQLATLLVDTGFAVEAKYQCFTWQPPDDTTPRIMWAARKRPSVVVRRPTGE